MTLVPETLDIAAGSRPCDTHQNLGMSSGDARDKDGARHSDIMMQFYRLLDYSHLVTDRQQSQRPSDPMVGEVSKRQKVCDFATDAAGGAALEGNQVSTTVTGRWTKCSQYRQRHRRKLCNLNSQDNDSRRFGHA